MLRAISKVKGFKAISRGHANFSVSMKSSNQEVEDVIFNNENSARIISLNRAKKLNSLNQSMVDKILARLIEYRKSNVANVVIIDSKASPRAFCAGGDVAQAAKDVQNGDVEKAFDFFYKEYSLNYLLSIYPKPVVSYLDGITMGGGVGLAVHSPFRIATENTRLAMPEMDIGYFPDVGTSFFLPRLDGGLGKFLALTGESIYGVDNFIAGFATHYVPSVRLEELTKRLGSLVIPNNEALNIFDETRFEDINEVKEQVNELFAIINNAIEEFTDPIPEDHQFAYSDEERNLIDSVFGVSSIEEMFNLLDSKATEGDKFAGKVLESLKKKSPISLKLANELIEFGSKSNNYDAILQELILSQNMMANPETNDFVEGVSKKLITKTNDASWKYKNVTEIPSNVISDLFSSSVGIKYSNLMDFGVGEYMASYKQYPFNMGLPTENEIKSYITGDDGSSRDYAPTKKEVFTKFMNQYHNKVGVNWKVANVLKRKTVKHSFDVNYINWES